MVRYDIVLPRKKITMNHESWMLGIESASCESINTFEYCIKTCRYIYPTLSSKISKCHKQLLHHGFNLKCWSQKHGGGWFSWVFFLSNWVVFQPKTCRFRQRFSQGLLESAPKQLSDPLSDALKKRVTLRWKRGNNIHGQSWWVYLYIHICTIYNWFI